MVTVLTERDACDDLDVVILVRDGVGSNPPEAPTGFTGRLYVQEPDGRLALVNPLDVHEVPALDAHAFSRLAPRDTAGYYFFPYGYASRYPGMGPIDSFGFRLPDNWLALRDRDKSHKVIVVSGGSAVWSQCALSDEAFPAVLERLLNDAAVAQQHPWRYSVLNFGQLGNLVLHQTMNYLLFADRIRPDVVIAHDGFNDLIFGLLSDAWLVREHAIAYQPEFEWWAQLLHNSPASCLTHATQPFDVHNLPHLVVGAYLERKGQFRRVVESSGAAFVWGIQPWIRSKAALSPEEAQAVAVKHDQYGQAHEKLEFVYDFFSEHVVLATDVPVVNCHEAFGQFDASERLFYDHVHTTPAGDRHVAALYVDAVRHIMKQRTA